MNVAAPIVVLATFALSYGLVGVVYRFAISKNLMDVPNERSSHAVATPRGGGIGIVVSFFAAITVLWALNLLSSKLWLLLFIPSAAVAGAGHVDDLYHLGAKTRFVVHLGAAVFLIATSGGYPAAELANWGVRGAWICPLFGLLAVVWSTNLFNFMDGIDGLAAGESTFISAAAGILVLINGGDHLGIAAVLFSLSAASLGFLFWNWPPARIFMGDVGSGFLGFVTCASLMTASIAGALPIEMLAILGGVFAVDATVTLIRRVLQGDRWSEPHRAHAYQRLARRFGSHRRVTTLVLGVNMLWLFPWALAANRFPMHGRVFLGSALLPLVIIAILSGAGRREVSAIRE